MILNKNGTSLTDYPSMPLPYLIWCINVVTNLLENNLIIIKNKRNIT